jgi:hypothetical protein
MSSYINRYVDYVAILRALEEVSRDRWERWGKQTTTKNQAAWAVSDYKTIGFTVGRQCGATNGIHKWIKEHRGQCLLISKDKDTRKNSLELYLKHHDDTDMTDYYRASARIVTTVEFSYEHDDNNDVLHKDMTDNVRYVILDDSAHHYVLGRSGGKAAFSQWVADTFHEDTFVILVK